MYKGSIEMEDLRVLAAEAAFKRVRDLIEEADRMDQTNLTTIHMVILHGEGSWTTWIGPNPHDLPNGLIMTNAWMKAEISLRTGKSVYDVLYNEPSLLLPHEQKLRSDSAKHKLHAGGVPLIDSVKGVFGSVGVAGAGRGLDCHCAKLGGSEYLYTLERLSSKAA